MNRAFFVIPPATLFAVFNSSLCFRRQREFRRRFGQEYKKFTPFSFPYTCQKGLSLRTITNIISDGSPILHESGFFRYSACNTLCRFQFVPLFQTAKRVSAAFRASVQKNHFVLFSVHLQKLSLRAITVNFSWLIRNGIKPLKLRLSYYRLGGKPRFFTFF